MAAILEASLAATTLSAISRPPLSSAFIRTERAPLTTALRASRFSKRTHGIAVRPAASASSSPSPSSSPSSSHSQAAYSFAYSEAPTATPWGSSTYEETTSELSSEESSDEGSRKDLMHEAVRRLADTDVAEAASKYGLEDELFGEIDFARISSFTKDPFGGNPAAVCYLPYHPSDEWLQKVAAEFNLSETAFLVRRRASSPPPPRGLDDEWADSTQQRQPLVAADERGALRPVKVAPSVPINEFDLRWFTPTVEARLCGHATLAAAHLLFSSGLVDSDEVVFHTRSGRLAARLVPEDEAHLGGRDRKHHTSRRNKRREWEAEAEADEAVGVGGRRRPSGKAIVELDMPLAAAQALPLDEWAAVEEAIGVVAGTALFVGRSKLHDIMVHVPQTTTVLELDPSLKKVALLPCRGVIVTAAASHVDADIKAAGGRAAALDPNIDFVSRYFAPQSGIDEDPVTGSSFCTLGPYWSEILGHKQMLGYQASSRGGMVAVRVDEAGGRAFLQGWAVLVMAGVVMNTASPAITHPATTS
ncbi:hypothetical protein CLOM_g22605 [Closterium sp. NIES-68]|nr:hypothetical protein CLOM_g22605 [Closterium sp. NIES-68]GJP76184.1 hypothetical protein CLOP_g6555 [Closterium sp. NIES-67]